MPKRLLRFGVSLLSGGLALLYFAINFAPLAVASSLSQGYHSSETISVGTVVSLTKSGSNEIQTTTSLNESSLLGVAVDSKNAIVDLQPQGSDVRVAISGEAPILVSDTNGAIKAGDNLIISQVAGVAMKDSATNTTAKKYIAVASESFDNKSPSAKQVTIKQNGADKSVAVGLIKAKILLSDRQSSAKPNPFLAFVENLIGRPVGTAQLIGSVAVFITTFTFTGLLLNGSVKGAFVSLGRNPLSKPAIISNMIRVSVIALVILIAGVAMAYVILLI